MKNLRKNLFTYSLNHLFTSPKNVKNLLPYSLNPLFPSQNAFTLTEVLVALTIVGVISALVLPAVVTRYQEKAFDNAYTRETQVIESAVDELTISENTASFFDTMMYKDAEPEDYNDSSKVFVNKYLRASKICSTGSDCFAKKYYTYEDNDKKVYTPEFKGTCAKLKNGASICITPQIGGVPVKGIIDINGDKGPNVLNKDLRSFEFTTWTRYGKNNEVAEVKDNNFAPIGGGSDPCEGMTCGCGDLPECDPCEGLTCGCGDLPDCEVVCSANPNEWDSGCCQDNKSSITDPSHHCCSYFSIKNHVSACAECPDGGIKVEGVGCVKVKYLGEAKGINFNNNYPLYRYYDDTCTDTGTPFWCSNNYWAGAKFMCDQVGMNLPDVTTLVKIMNTRISGMPPIPINVEYWSNLQDPNYEIFAIVAGYPSPAYAGSQAAKNDTGFHVACVK